jgi:N-hydroxyarylamine O-acetyltransferase
MTPKQTSALFIRYLKLLKIRIGNPDYLLLCRLVKAQMEHAPFENISKLYYKSHLGLTDIPSLELYLDGMENYHFGGTCYSNNYYFHLLLKYLGYNIKLCGADMANPDVHMVSIVKLDGNEYIIDVGYGAPFMAPLPRDLKEDYIIKHEGDQYILRTQDINGCSRLELLRRDQQTHGYLVKPQLRDIGHFKEVIANSFRPDATFMNAILLVRFSPGKTIVIHNYSLIESMMEKETRQKLITKEELISAIEKHFGIPPQIALDALSQVQTFKNAWS